MAAGGFGKAGIGAGIAAIATVIRRPPSDELWHVGQMTTYDLRVRATARPSAPSERVVLVSIDDDSVRRMAPLVGRWPWPRLAHATLIDFLARAPAKLVVYDVLFTEAERTLQLGGDAGRPSAGTGEEWTGADSDEALAEAIKEAGNIVLAADAAAEELVDSRDVAGSSRRHSVAQSAVQRRRLRRTPTGAGSAD